MKNVEALALQELLYNGETEWDVSDEMILNSKTISTDGWDDYEELYESKNTYELQVSGDDKWFRKMLSGGVERIR